MTEAAVEVGAAPGSRPAFLQPHVIHREAFDQQLFQARGGPLAECGAASRADAVADNENGVETVVKRAVFGLRA